MAKSQFQSQLASMTKTWKGAKEKQDEMFGGQMIPAAQYQAQLINAKLILTKQSQKLAISRNFLIVDGEFEGKNISDMMGLAFNELSPVFARRWIEQMGYAAPEDLAAELENVLEAISKDAMYCKIKVKHSGTYYNIDVLEAWSSTDEETAPGAEAETEPEGEESEGEEEGEAEDDETESGPDEEVRVALLTFAASQDLDGTEIADDDTLETLKEKLSAFQWKPEELADGEEELLRSVGLDACIIKPAPTKPKAPPAKPKAAAAPAKPAAASTTKAAPAKPAAKPVTAKRK